MKWFGAIGFVIATVGAYAMYETVCQQGFTLVNKRAVVDARLIVNITEGFVKTYAKFKSIDSSGELPHPATFRAKALQHVADNSQEIDSISTGVVGIPGREIAQKAKDENMRNQLLELEAFSSNRMIANVIHNNGQSTHRSLWSVVASQACADCHNQIQNLTGANQWRAGDVMGAQVVEQDIAKSTTTVVSTAFAGAALSFVAIIAIWFCCLYLFNQNKLNRKLKTLATTDPLTGCINRRELYNRINKLNERIYGAVLMLDLDKFKLINDTYGHDVGDKVIQDFTLCMRGALREDDWIARFGGEEFVVWLPNVKPIDAIRMAERFRNDAAQAQVIVNDRTITYTVSIGLQIIESAKSTAFESWMKAADKLLYRAKAEGRNRIVAHAM